jgi:hypothetical protein
MKEIWNFYIFWEEFLKNLNNQIHLIKNIIFSCWRTKSIQRLTTTDILQKTSRLLKTIENDLWNQARDETISEVARIKAIIRLVIFRDNTISWQHLKTIRNIVDDLNSSQLLQSLDMNEISQSYANRLQLIDSITMDCDKFTYYLPYYYANLIYRCFWIHSAKFLIDSKCTDFDRKICCLISKLIIDKMRFILSDGVWLNANWTIDKDRIYILHYFTSLLVEYRVETNIEDMKLLRMRVEEMIKIQQINELDMNVIIDRIIQLESMQPVALRVMWNSIVNIFYK